MVSGLPCSAFRIFSGVMELTKSKHVQPHWLDRGCVGFICKNESQASHFTSEKKNKSSSRKLSFRSLVEASSSATPILKLVD
jgi:hypothetical protein